MLPPAYAITIGATPGSMSFTGVAKGGYAEREFIITTSSEVNVTGHVDFGGDAASWVRLDTNMSRFVISRDHPFRGKVVVEPPADAQTGNYTSLVSFVTESTAAVGGTTGSAVRASVAISVSIEIVGEQFISCTVGGYSVSSTETNRPIEFSASILNGGNVRLRPQVSFTIWDQLKRTIVHTYGTTGPQILPTTRMQVLSRIEHSLPTGQYWLEVSIPDCKTTNEFTFSVVEPGQIADAGDLDGIFVMPFSYVNEPTEVTVVFTNKGPRSVVAKFQGILQKENVPVRQLDSQELVVVPGEQSNFKLSVTPQEAGEYVVTGRVLYNGKLTFEQGASFTALAQQESFSFSWIGIVIYFIILIAVVVLVILIRREMRRGRK